MERAALIPILARAIFIMRDTDVRSMRTSCGVGGGGGGGGAASSAAFATLLLLLLAPHPLRCRRPAIDERDDENVEAFLPILSTAIPLC